MNKSQLESSCSFSYCTCNSIGWPFLSCIFLSECLKICFKKVLKLIPYKQCQIKWMLKLKLLCSEFFCLSWTSKPWGLKCFVSQSFWNKIMHYNNEKFFGHNYDWSYSGLQVISHLVWQMWPSFCLTFTWTNYLEKKFDGS